MSEEEKIPKTTGGISVNSDWVKIVITIVMQSIAIGFFVSTVKSDLNHLAQDFADFKTQDFKDFKQTVLSDITTLKEAVPIIKAKMDAMSEGRATEAGKVLDLEKQVRDGNDKIYTLKEQVRDVERDMQTLREKNGIYVDSSRK